MQSQTKALNCEGLKNDMKRHKVALHGGVFVLRCVHDTQCCISHCGNSTLWSALDALVSLKLP
jgi:hypothetical protein